MAIVKKWSQFTNRANLSDNDNAQIMLLDTTTGTPSTENQRTPVTQILRSAKNLSDVANPATALVNLGVSATATELNYVSGVTSAIQTQLNSKQIGLNVLAVGVTPNVAGITLLGPNFNLEPASASFPGVVTTGTQSFAGNKTFTGSISASNLSNTNSGDVSLNSFGVVDNAAGLSLTGQVLTMQPASATNPGGVSTGTQTFAGNKTFSGTIAASNLSNTNTGDISLTNVGVTPNAAGMSLSAQVLNLQPADGTNPGVLSAGAQTIGGVKTLTSNLILNNSNAIGIGTATPDASAMIDLTSTTRGFKLPIMTSTQRTAISSPASALMVYESSSVVPWINLIAFGWAPFVVGSVAINQVMVSSGPGLATGSSGLTVISGSVINTLAGSAFRGTGSNSYIGIGANSSGTNGTMFGEANTATTFFSSTAAGDSVVRNSDTTKFVRIGVGSSTAQLNVGNTFAYIQTALGIATTSPVAPLGFSTTAVNRKISLSGAANDHQDEAIGTTAASIRYQVRSSAFSHVFQAGISGVASLEIMRMVGNGQVAIGTASPNAASILQVDSTTQSFLPPRMTTTQKNAITTPPSGSIVYDITLGKLCVFGAAAWETITSI